MKTTALCAALLLAALGAAPVCAQSSSATTTATTAAASAPIHEWTLPNGLHFIVQPDHRAPTAVHMVWVRVGSMDEVSGTSGVAHMLEHMMFKGTPTVAAGEFSRRVAQMGGRDNAFTSRDYTAYFQQVPANKLRDVMLLEADRFANSHFSDEEFTREMAVVKEERRLRTDDVPRAVLMEQLSAVAWTAHPYRRPIIGWMDDLNAMTANDVRAFWQRWYTPANVAVVIVGDVDVAQVRAWSQQIWGGWSAAALPQRKPQAEPTQLGARHIAVHQVARQAQVALLWHAPTLGTLRDAPTAEQQDAAALIVLSAVLDGYDGARLERALVQGLPDEPNLGKNPRMTRPGSRVEQGKNAPKATTQDAPAATPKRLADAVGSMADVSTRGAGAFLLTATPAAGVSAQEVIAALRGQIERIAREGVSAQELERVKTQWMAAQVYGRDSMMGQAIGLGSGWALGHPVDAQARLIAQLQAVTAEQVQSVAARYFEEKGMNAAILVPEKPPADVKPKMPAPVNMPLRH